MRLYLLLFICMCTGSLISCKNTSSSAGTTPAADSVVTDPVFIREKKWSCVELNGKLPAVANMYIVFSDSTFGGRGACNSYGGKVIYAATAGIRLLNIYSTEMACDGLNTEQEYFNTLQAVDQFRLNGDTLTLLKGKMVPVIKLVPVNQ